MLDNKLSKDKFNEIMSGYKDIVSFDRFLNEGVYDPHIFKAFFLAGGPGSGKSFISRTLFTGTGMKMVNSDAFLTNTLRAAEFIKKAQPKLKAEPKIKPNRIIPLLG